MDRLRNKRVLFVFLCLALILLPPVFPANASAPTTSDNRDANSYTTYNALPVKSYLYQEDDALFRVEYCNGQLLVEQYDTAFSLLSAQTIPLDSEFNRWGGFFAGEDFLFVIIGKDNPSEDDNAEVIRIIQFDKNWNRLQQTGLYGANTVVPFDFGSLHCDEYGGMLYIHTCHSMYQTQDGLNHQANMLLAVRQKDMKITDAQYTVSNSAKGYVSHSFNQFVLADSQGRLITLNHGDMYPRAAILIKYPLQAGNEKLFGDDILAYGESFYLCEFPMGTVYQKTGAALGGLAETKTAYITAYNNDGSGGDDNAMPRNVYLTVTDKSDFSKKGTVTHQLTSYTAGTQSAGTPVLAPDSAGGGYVLWKVQQLSNAAANTTANKIAYVSYDANGNISSPVETDGMLSDCQPILYNGKTVWYVTDNSTPIFYVLDHTGLRTFPTGFSDVPSDSWYNQAVHNAAQKGWILPNGEKFLPEQNADRGTLVYALHQMEGCPAPGNHAAFADVPADLMPAISWAAENGIVNGMSPDTFAPYDAITREQLAALLYRYASWKGYDVSASSPLELWYSDAGQISAYALTPLRWANAQGLITGNTASTLNPQGNATRAEIATILMRFSEKF